MSFALVNLCLVVGMDGTLLCHQKAGSAPGRRTRPASAQLRYPCRLQFLRRQHRIFTAAPTYLRDQRHGGRLRCPLDSPPSAMTANATAALDHPRHCGRSYHRDDLDSGLHPAKSCTFPGCLPGDDHRDLLYHDLRTSSAKRAHQHHIDSKWAFGQLSGFVYLPSRSHLASAFIAAMMPKPGMGPQPPGKRRRSMPFLPERWDILNLKAHTGRF